MGVEVGFLVDRHDDELPLIGDCGAAPVLSHYPPGGGILYEKGIETKFSIAMKFTTEHVLY